MIQITRRRAYVRAMLMACLTGSALVGAAPVRAQLYIHSPDEEKASNQVKEGINAAKKAHLEALEAHKTRLQAAIDRERQLIAQRELAVRDAVVVEIMERHDDRDNPASELKNEVFRRLSQLTGLRWRDAVDGGSAAVDEVAPFLNRMPARLRYSANMVNRTNRDLQEAGDARSLLIKAFEAGGGKGTYCKADGTPAPQAQTMGTAEEAFAAIEAHCAEMVTALETEATSLASLPEEAKAIVGARNLTPGSVRGELGRALLNSQNLRTLIEAQAALAKAAKKQLSDLEKFYRCELARSNNTASDEVTEAAGRIEKFSTWLAALDADKLAEQLPAVAPKPNQTTPPADPANPPAAAGTCQMAMGGKTETVKKPPEVDNAAELARLAEIKTNVRQALVQAGAFAPGRSVVAAIREEAEEFKASKLSQIVAAFAKPGEQAETDRARIAASVLKLIDYSEQLWQVHRGELPDTSAVLVRLAGAKMKAATAQLEAQRLQQLGNFADLKVAALREEALMLIDAARSLAGSGAGAFDRALMNFSDSWAKGRMPALVVDTDVRNQEHLTWAAREHVAVEAAYAVLEPAAQELQTYGASGVKPAEIAQWLQTLGVGSIAIGGE